MDRLSLLLARRGTRDIATVLGVLVLVVGLGIAMSAEDDTNSLLGGVILCGVALVVLIWVSYQGRLTKSHQP